MSKDNTHDDFDFGNNPEFQENFYKNIDRVLSDEPIEYENPGTEDIADADLLEETVDPTEEDRASEEMDTIDDTMAYGEEAAANIEEL
ncbi:MAG: hypothetical protein PHC56_07015, partial [Herbinix sp.]|nr:hypothetical protein [Herbinix sp.]